MKILLPPSETKRVGGDGQPMDENCLALPTLGVQRRAVIDALIALSADERASQRVLKLSDRQLEDVLHNRMLREAPTMPAIDRYTGVLYDALDAPTLSAAAREHLGERVWIHSAPFGPVAALDGIPIYRLAAGASLPGIPPLRRHWAEATTAAIAGERPAFLLDLRSEAYAALGPVPAGIPSVYVRVVTADGRALNHFNKRTKGLFIRAFAEDLVNPGSFDELADWAAARGFVLRRGNANGEWELLAAE